MIYINKTFKLLLCILIMHSNAFSLMIFSHVIYPHYLRNAGYVLAAIGGIGYISSALTISTPGDKKVELHAKEELIQKAVFDTLKFTSQNNYSVTKSSKSTLYEKFGDYYQIAYPDDTLSTSGAAKIYDQLCNLSKNESNKMSVKNSYFLGQELFFQLQHDQKSDIQRKTAATFFLGMGCVGFYYFTRFNLKYNWI